MDERPAEPENGFWNSISTEDVIKRIKNPKQKSGFRLQFTAQTGRKINEK